MPEKKQRLKRNGKARLPRVDTIRGAQLAMEAALAGTLLPPKHIKLSKRDLPFWKDIIDCRARQLWNDSDLALAAYLTRCKSLLEKYSQDMEKEPLMLESKTGRMYHNPKIERMDELSRQIVQYSRLLHVHARTAVGKPDEGIKKLEEENRKKAVVKAVRGNVRSLIKMPSDYNG